LRSLVTAHPAERIAFGDLLHGLGPRGFGLILLLLALPNSFPIPSPPGVSTLFGVPMMLLAAQIALKRTHPWLPAFIRRKTIAREDLLRLLDKAEPWILKVERYLHPRLHHLTLGVSRRIGGLVAFLMAAIMSLPIVFGNFLPALAILLIALALTEDDGVLMLAGWTVAIIATAVIGLIVYIGTQAIHIALVKLFGF
jgi:hypothetical protein